VIKTKTKKNNRKRKGSVVLYCSLAFSFVFFLPLPSVTANGGSVRSHKVSALWLEGEHSHRQILWRLWENASHGAASSASFPSSTLSILSATASLGSSFSTDSQSGPDHSSQTPFTSRQETLRAVYQNRISSKSTNALTWISANFHRSSSTTKKKEKEFFLIFFFRSFSFSQLPHRIQRDRGKEFQEMTENIKESSATVTAAQLSSRGFRSPQPVREAPEISYVRKESRSVIVEGSGQEKGKQTSLRNKTRKIYESLKETSKKIFDARKVDLK
jgi:hypothetical protein